MPLYRHPGLYRAFFAQSPEMRASIDSLVRMHGPRRAMSRSRVLDPACGPGLWLEHFAERGAEVAGVEREADVARATQARLGRTRAIVLEGDMRSPPRDALMPKGRPFDVAINLDNSVGHLGGTADVVAHLAAMHALLSRGGVYLIGLAIREPGDEVKPSTIYECGPIEVEGGGFAAVRSETRGLVRPERRSPARYERIRHLILAAGVEGLSALTVEQYDLLVFPYTQLREILDASGPWRILDCRDATDESLPRRRCGPGAGDVLLVLRPDATRAARATKPRVRKLGTASRGRRG